MLVSLKFVFYELEDETYVHLTTGEGCTGTIRVPVHARTGSDGTCLLEPGIEGRIFLKRAPQASPKHTKKRLKKISVKQEEKLAQSHGGRRHHGSGNQTGYEGDVRVDGRYRIEAKFTTKKSYPVRRAELNKIRSECALGEVPLFVIDFKDPQTLRTEDSWVLVPRSEWEKHAKATDD